MKEMNSLETQLRSWQPRRPSSALRRRLFGITLAPRAAWLLGPLAPAAACALLTMAICGPRGGLSAGQRPIIVASNFITTASSDGFANKQNCWSLVTFDSTNHSGLGLFMDSLRH